MSKRALQKLHQLLQVERAALLAGNLEAIHDISAEKEALTKDFDGADSADLSTLSVALERNSALLTAAHDGVSLVLTTLRKQRDARETLSGYDSSGQATTISKRPHGTERRF